MQHPVPENSTKTAYFPMAGGTYFSALATLLNFVIQVTLLQEDR